jgi:hypothetical protein
MDDLIAKLVPPKQQRSAQRLLEDQESRNLIRQQLSQMAEDEPGLLPQKSFSWILCKLVTFGAAENDTLRIYQAFLSQIHELEHLCRALSGEGPNCRIDPPATVASRLTVGLGLFYEHAARRHRYHGAPSPRYYEHLAAGCFALTGYKTIAARLPEWLEFLRESFVLPGLQVLPVQTREDGPRER